jgi:hypothetical protein
MFLGLPDPDTGPLVRGVDPATDSDSSIILLSSSKNSKKNIDILFCDFIMTFHLPYLQKGISIKPSEKIIFCWHIEGH